MSADMMIVCEEDNSTYDGKSELALFIDETSMGDPWHEFGKWFASRFCGAPGLFEQMAGIKEHNFTQVTKSEVVAVEHALGNMELHDNLKTNRVMEYFHNHVGKHISTENW